MSEKTNLNKNDNKISDRRISVETEFQALRSEILSWQSSDTNVTIYMYVLSITVIGFSLQFNNPILLFLFEVMLQSFRKVTTRLSAYIVVFLQTDRNEYFYWESNRLDLQKLSKKNNNFFSQYFIA